MEELSVGGSRYFLLIKDDFSHFRHVEFLKQKSEVYDKIKNFLELSKKVTGNEVKTVRSDNGTEFINERIRKLFESRGITHQKSVKYAPEQNGRVEREMRTVVEAARSMLHAKSLSKDLWAEAVHTAVYILNRTGKSTVETKTPYELFYGTSFDINKLQIFGSEVFAHIPKQKRAKWDAKGEKGIFAGYSSVTKGYRIYFPKTRSVEILRDVVFVNTKHIKSDNKPNDENYQIMEIVDENELIEPDHFNQDIVNVKDQEEEKFTYQSSDTGEEEDDTIDGKRKTKKPGWLDDYETSYLASSLENEPSTYAEAMSGKDSGKWSEAIQEELKVLEENNTWSLVDLPSDKSAISCKWVFKIKNCESGVKQYKARLVARGFEQKECIDVSEIYAPVAKLTTFRIFIVMANKLKLPAYQMDVHSAFLYGKIEDEIYMYLPEGIHIEWL